MDLCPQKVPNLVIHKTQHGYDEESIIISHIPLLGLFVVRYHLGLDDASYKRESYANGKIADLWNSVKMDCKKNPVFIDCIKDNRVFMLVGGKGMPYFSYSYKIWKQ